MDKKIYYSTILFFVVLIVLNVFTSYIPNSTDLGDYLGAAKSFNNDFSAKMRSTHSWIFGFLLAPLMKLIPGVFVTRLLNFIWLPLIALLLFFITKSKKAFFTFLLSPVVWFVAPSITPILPASFLFILTYYYFKKFESKNNYFYLIISGLSLGLASLLWDTVFLVFIIFSIVFFFDKKIKDLAIFSIFFGLIASIRFIFDWYFFNFPFFSLFKFLGGNFMYLLGLTPLGQLVFSPYNFFILLILPFPLFIYCLFKSTKNNFKEYSKEIIFSILYILMFLKNAQIRYMLFLTPFFIILLYKSFNKKIFLFNILISILIIPFFIYPPSVYERDNLIQNDLVIISSDYSNNTLLAISGNPKNLDFYYELAIIYQGDKINEFISQKDYEMWKNNNTNYWNFNIVSDASKRIYTSQDYFINFGLKRTPNKFDFNKIEYLISDSNSLSYEEFKVDKCYKLLCVYKR